MSLASLKMFTDQLQFSVNLLGDSFTAQEIYWLELVNFLGSYVDFPQKGQKPDLTPYPTIPGEIRP